MSLQRVARQLLIHHLTGQPHIWVAQVWRSAWVETSAIPAAAKYLLTILRMERVPWGFSHVLRKEVRFVDLRPHAKAALWYGDQLGQFVGLKAFEACPPAEV